MSDNRNSTANGISLVAITSKSPKQPREEEYSARRNYNYGSSDAVSDLKLCPPWQLDPDDTRSIVDFIDEFWSYIGQFTCDQTLCILRFNNILRAAPKTRLVSYCVRDYIEDRQASGLEPEFSYAKKTLLSIFWSTEHQEEIKQEFYRARYDPRDNTQTMLDFITTWYNKLEQFKHLGPIDTLHALMDKMPGHMRLWVKIAYNKKYPDSASELAEWVVRYDESKK